MGKKLARTDMPHVSSLCEPSYDFFASATAMAALTVLGGKLRFEALKTYTGPLPGSTCDPEALAPPPQTPARAWGLPPWLVTLSDW